MEPILEKSLKKIAEKWLICLGADKEIKYDPSFKLYMTTKLPNPTYKAEVSTKVNFFFKEIFFYNFYEIFKLF